MIINSGMRTDIPGYYSEWFYNRIKEGFVYVRNPYYPEQVTRYNLSSDVVDCICFCTKNPEPMLDRMDEISGFKQFWFVTITPYGKDIEPFVPDKMKVMESFKKLSEKIGKNAVSWRYDPIFITDRYSLDFHIESFEKMAKNLSGYTDNCVISFIDLYQKTKRNFPEAREVTKDERLQLGREFAGIGNKYGIKIRTCCEGTELAVFGVDVTGCMTKNIIERAIGCSLDVPKGKKMAREECDCLITSDIGMYNTCGHGCVYCYANYDRDTVVNNMKFHNSASPFLIGDVKEGDVISDAKQEPWSSGQMMLFFE